MDSLAPDIAVIQECARPKIQNDQCLWFGDNPRQGMAVIAKEPYRIRALTGIVDAPRYMIPVEVVGPVNFLLMAVWSKRNPDYPYIEAVVRAVELYRDLLARARAVVIGDLNSNAIWNADHPRDMNHSALVNTLSELGLVSAYHTFFREDHGSEKLPTYYFWWKQERPFHIDYCFIPTEWAKHLKHVEVGSYADWKAWSDHRPLLMELSEGIVL